MNNSWHFWLEFPDKTFLSKEHPKFPEYNAKYLSMNKETMAWKFVGAEFPPEHYGLKLLDFPPTK